MSSFYTSDYQVIFCQSKGEKEFKTQFHDYNILVHRKMAFALLKITANKSKPHIIPLFEEAMIYFQNKVNSVLKNTARCLVLSSKPRGKDCLHVFGDSAFTCEFPFAIGSSSDRHQTSMMNAGIIIGLLDKVRHLTNGVEDEKASLMGMFRFLIGDNRVRAKRLLTQIVKNERQYAIDNASDPQRLEIGARHGEVIKDDELLSRSFLANQIGSKAITDKNGQNTRVPIWIASATFSIIVMQTKGKKMTYRFLQTYPFEEDNSKRILPAGLKKRPVPNGSEPQAKNAKKDDALMDPSQAVDPHEVMLDVTGSASNGPTAPGTVKAAFQGSKSGGLPLELELELELL
jgi:hypothetical protein